MFITYGFNYILLVVQVRPQQPCSAATQTSFLQPKCRQQLDHHPRPQTLSLPPAPTSTTSSSRMEVMQPHQRHHAQVGWVGGNRDMMPAARIAGGDSKHGNCQCSGQLLLAQAAGINMACMNQRDAGRE